MPLPFNKNLDLKLLKLVKENPILYHSRHTKYLDFDSREVVWQKIGDSLRRPAVSFAGLQCQIQLGDYDEKKHKPGFIEKLEEYLPAQYLNAWSVEKKITKEFASHQGNSELEAKFLYIKTARALPTYGVTFFLVKEKQKDKKKLVPRLLGINAEAILRLDEVTKEILQQWPLTHVKTYHAGKSQTFTLNFGDYSDKEYSVKTQDCHRIRDILEGYIDIIRRRMLAKPCADVGESMAICHDNVQQGKSHLIQHVANNPSKIVTESFVGPNKLVPYDQGSQAQSGAMITTVQQIVVTDHLQNQQQALKGEMPLRGDMSKDCIRKLNRLNSNSVKIVGLLTDPTETHIKDAQQIVRAMQEDFPVVEQGVKETADKQTIDDARKMLLDELQDLNNFMNKLAGSLETGKANPNDAKDAAESIADLTTQMYFSIDPKTKRRSELLRRSRKSFRDGEKTEQTMRRASFIAAATTALHSVDNAAQALQEDYTGRKLSEEEQKELERALEDRLGKLNAAIALYLMAHSDPDNIDYSAAINSMNAINELMPKLARDAQILANSKDPAARKQLQDEMRTLCEATKKVCGMSGNQDHEKMQEATNQYADVAGNLLYKFSEGNNADKENEIVQLAKDVGAKVSRLLVATNELTCQAQDLPACSEVDDAGARTAGAARDLMHTAQLTAPAIHQPHCQSALTAAAAHLSSAVHQLENTWRPVVEDPTRQHMADLLHTRANDVAKALERLRDAYGNLEGDQDDSMLPKKEKRRLKFITTLSGAKNRLQGVKFDEWNKLPPSGADAPSEQQKAAAQQRLEQKMGQINAAVAALAAATADRKNPDYDTAELALGTITELMPKIANDMEIVSSDKDEATRNALRTNLCAMCDAAQEICEGDGYQHAQGEPLANFAAASGKLVFLVSPGADKGKQKHILDLSSAAHQQASELVSHAQRVQEHVQPGAAAELADQADQTHDDAQALRSVAQVTAASIGEDRCRDALSSAVSKLQGSADMLNSSCQAQHTPQLSAHCAAVKSAHSKLSDSLGKLADVCDMDALDDSPAQQEKQRLKFVQSMAGAKRRLDAAAQQLTKPMACHVMTEEHAAVLEQQLSDRLAQLNAAVAALTAATADREHPNYLAAEQAVKDITTLMPLVVQDSRKLCGTKNAEGQAAILQDIKALCDASKEICDSAGQPQGLADAAARFTAASRNLMFFASPGIDTDKENEVIGLSADACGKASQLLSQVQHLTEMVPDAGVAAELDSRGARAADAAQALLTIAQATAPSIGDPHCQKELILAAEKLRSTASDLTSSCQLHLDNKPEMKQQVLSSQKQLEDSINALINSCEAAGGGQRTISPAEKEKRRLKFINSLTGAKNRLYDSEQQLNQPLTRQSLIPEEAAALEHRLSDRLAQLNAAVAALAAAKADPAHPDYAAAEKAVKEISELMPLIVQDSRKLSSIKEPAAQAAMLEDLKALCQASRTICENTENSPKVNTADFNKAASKLVYLVSPTADKKKERQVLDLSEDACKRASDYLSTVQSTSVQLGPNVAAQLGPAEAKVQDAADTLNAVAHATSPTISEPSCSAAVVSAAENLRSTASELTARCSPHMQQAPEMKQEVLGSQRRLTDSLDKLVSACQPGLSGNLDAPSAQQQEKQRLTFISSVSGAKDKLDAAEQQLKQPMVCQLMSQEDGAAMEHKLSNRLAQLNAAVAALAAATADRERPDYAAADRAVKTISELMPQLVKESRTVCGTKTGEAQAAMLQDLRALCEASREICDSAGQPQGLSDAAAKFSAASGKLTYIVSPKAQDAHEKQVIALSAASCGKASELLTQVQRLTELVPDAAQAAELDNRGARTADAAQALLTVAQATAPTIGDPHCQKELVSAAEKLRGTATDLTSSCAPHLTHKPELKQQVSSSKKHLDDSLDKLVQACKTAQLGNLVDAPSAQQQEKQRLTFISSVSGAKDKLHAAEQQLKQPMVCQLMSQEDGAAMEHKLSNRLAQLNAAVAALAAATADRERPDYAAADRAVKTISELMPQLVKESRTVCGTKTGEEQAAMLQDLRALCEASREICDSAGQPQGLSDAAAKFSGASGKLVYIVSPKAQDAHEKQVIALSAASCGKAGELLTQVQRLTELVPDAAQAAELDNRGARTADAAQALLTVAQATAPTIGDPHCQKELVSAAEKLRGTATDLTSSCAPHLTHKPELKQQVSSSKKQLDDSLDKLVQACKTAQLGNLVDAPSAQQQEKQRLTFISSVSGAKDKLHAAEQQLKQPMVCQLMSQEDGAAMEHKLSNRLAQLNAAVAALAAATADRERPDYAAADRAVKTISELMPQLVKESRTVCGTKTGEEQAAMLQDLRALCEASREICDSAGQPQGLSDAAAKFSAASGNLVYIVSPKAQDAHEKQVIALSAASCGKAGELLTQVQRLAELVPDAAQAAELDNRGARTADAAQALLTVAQATAPTIGDPHCQKELVSAAEKLRGTATDLTSSCAPHLTHKPELKQQVSSSKKQLDDSLDKLVQACKTAQLGNLEDAPSAQQQEKQRLTFISSVSGAKDKLYAAEQQLKQPMICQLMRQEDGAAMEHKLSNRLAQLNAAVAALAAATADRERPDYAAADRSVKTISELMPQLVKESRTVCGTKTGEEQAAMLQDLRALCEASREICDSAGQPQGLSDAAAKFSAASGKLVYVVSPKAQDAHEKQVIALSAASCGKAGELLTQVQRLTELVPDAAQAAELDNRGARTADAAQALLTVAQATAPTIGDPHCQKEIISAAEKLRGTAADLTTSCQPHLVKKPELKQQVSSSKKQLDDSLDKLVQACKTAHHGNLVDAPLAQQQEKQRLTFISSVSGAKDKLHAAEQQLKQPMICQLMSQEDGAAMEHKLSNRLAQLNAAVAALAAATADRERPDYAAADRAVKTISELMPQLVKESHTVCGTKTGEEQAAMLQDLRALCEASREICDSAGQPQGLSDAAAKFSAASGKLVYVVSPKAQDAHEKQVIALSAASCGKASELLTQVQRLTELVPDAAQAAELDNRGARTADAAQALLTVAQATAPTIGDPHCQREIISAAEKLRGTAADLTSSCQPHLAKKPELKQQVSSSKKQLDDSLDKLVQACKTAQNEHQEKHRQKFISSVSGVKNHFDAAEKHLKEPLQTQTKHADPAILQHRLSDRLAQLNAAVAALTAATADRECPDYATAHHSVESIPKLLREVIHDSHALSATKDGPGAAAISEDLRALCEASRKICENAGQPQGLVDAAAKFSSASAKMMVVAGPKTHSAQEKQVIDLTAASCGKADELLSQVQRVSELVPDAAQAAELDNRGARTADATQALLTVAQITAPSISEPDCGEQLISAAEKLRSTALDLTSSCAPHLTHKPELKQHVSSSQKQLDDNLDKLVQACKTAQHEGTPSAQQEKQRLKFISSVSGVKNHFDAAEKQLKEPLQTQTKHADPATLQRKLSDRLAQLNAAVAALTAATADREHPDYATAHRAVESIPKLLREVIHDSRALSAIKDGPGAAAMPQDLRALCEASREICENAGQPQGLGDAAAKFSAASGKMMVVAGPKTHSAQEKQVIDLSAASCGKASELLSQVQRLSELVPNTSAAAELDHRGARAADAAQGLLNVVQITASSISEPGCADQLIAAAEKLRSTAGELTSSCAPHLTNKPELKQQVSNSQKQLDDSLDKLIQACQQARQGTEAVLSPQQEKQRMKFVSSVSGAQKHLDTAEQQIKKPVVIQNLKQADSASLQHQLSRRLAQLNAAVAALAAATQDGKNPDYPAAERAVTTVIELVPGVVQDSHTLCGTKDSAEQAAMLKHLRELCDASRAICDSAGQPKKLNEASAKLANASGKLVYMVGPEGTQGSKPSVPVRRPPPPTPTRDTKHTTAPAVRSSAQGDATQDFLNTLRGEESQGQAKIVAVDAKNTQAIADEKKAYKRFCEMIDSAEKGLKTAEESIKVLHSSAPAGGRLPAAHVARREQHVEDALARAAVQLAALVAANYADKLDYKAAMDPTLSLTESVKSVVNDGSVLYSSLPEQARKPFLEDMSGLCQATKKIVDAAKSKEEVKKLNDAAISFGDQSVKLLRVVSCNIDPALEKQMISRAKAIGDTASRIALEASNVASNANSSEEGQTHVQDICSAGASCVDTAGKLVYTAKLIAPTFHHAICQDALVSSADNLSSSLTQFSKTWAPLESSQQPTVQKLTQEAAHLENLVERLRRDVKSGKLGKRREMGQSVNLDSPLRQMTVQVIDTAKHMSEYGEMPAEQKSEYVNYSARLEEAIHALDLANARSQRAPYDRNKRDELDIATQDLQVTLLQTRPSRAGQEQNNIVDFRDFLQDLVKEAWELKSTAKKNEGLAGKRTADDIKLLSSKISEDATKLLNPSDNVEGVTVMNSVDDIMDIDMFGQECDVLLKEINTAIQGIHDQKAKQALRAKALPLTESCNLLRFAVNSHIMATKSLAYDDALQSLDNFKASVMQPLAKEVARKSQVEKKVYSTPLGSEACCRRASSYLLQARQRAVLGDPQPLTKAVTYLAAAAVHQPRVLECETLTEVVELPQVVKEDRYLANIKTMVDMTNEVTLACMRSESIQLPTVDVIYNTDTQVQSVLKELNELDYIISSRKIKTPVLNSEDIDKLLMCKRQPVEGTPKQLEDKLHQLSTKLSSMSGTVILSVKKPESLARSLHATADVAAQLANTARALEDSKRPVQCKKIEEAAHEMCLATYSLLKTSELVCQEPNHHDARRKLQDACRDLNDSINKLVRSVEPSVRLSPSGRVNQECGEVHRSLQLQRSLLQASPQPCGALPYVHCVDTLQSQRDVLQKLNSDQAMSREEFLKSLNYVASAVSNSTECAAQAAYLLSVSEKDESIGKEGIVDVAKLHKAVGAVEETCISIIMANDEEQVKEETAVLKIQVQDLQQGMDDGIKKTKEGEVKDMLKTCRNEIAKSSNSLFSSVQGNPNNKEEIISKVMDLMDNVNDASGLSEHPDLVPTAGEVSAETQKQIDEVVKSSLALVTNTEELIKQVKAAPEEPEMMKWVMFNKRKDVLDAFENLLKNVKTSGQRAKLIEGSTDDSEEEKKSYVQKQFDSASKWLLKPMSKPEVKTNGQQAVRNLIEVANKVTVDLKGSDKEDMTNLVMETEQLLTECTKKYDQEQYSVLMERVRELKKGIERGVVTRVVEDFIDAEAPLADLDLVDYEKDESKRKFHLEKKIAELLAQLSRVTKTARLIADTDKDAGTTVSTQLNSCSEQAELLAPMLVKAAQQRVATPDDKAVIENYKALLSRYAESLSKIRDLCDQSVDPMDFVQTAGVTMERMREESTKHNDPMKCAHTSAAITKLANRVIHVSMSSSNARADPELARALKEAHAQLAAASPPADTRASKMPDWKDQTAKMLQATEQVESLLGGENVFNTQPGPNQPIYNEALNLHVAIRDWSSRDNEIVAVAKRMAVLMAKLSNFMTNDKQREVLSTSKSIVTESHEVTRLAKKLAHECTDHRIKTNLLQTCERIPTISGQLKMLTTVKGFSLGRHGTQEDKEALDMLVGNAQSLMMSIQDVVKGAASASVKIMSQRGPRMKWVRKTVY